MAGRKTVTVEVKRKRTIEKGAAPGVADGGAAARRAAEGLPLKGSGGGRGQRGQPAVRQLTKEERDSRLKALQDAIRSDEERRQMEAELAQTVVIEEPPAVDEAPEPELDAEALRQREMEELKQYSGRGARDRRRGGAQASGRGSQAQGSRGRKASGSPRWPRPGQSRWRGSGTRSGDDDRRRGPAAPARAPAAALKPRPASRPRLSPAPTRRRTIVAAARPPRAPAPRRLRSRLRRPEGQGRRPPPRQRQDDGHPGAERRRVRTDPQHGGAEARP